MIQKETMKAAVKEVWIRSLTVLQPDVLEALTGALERERSPRGREYLGIMIENAKRAAEGRMVICQDTGVPTFFVRTPLDFPFVESVRETFDEALRELTCGEFPMRPMVVNPFTREDRGDNTAARVPVIHTRLDNGIGYMEIMAMPKGAGSGIWSALKMLPSTEGIAGVKRFVIDSVLNAGANPCPPIIVGVGVGGPMEEVALLATEATVRPLNERNPDAEAAALERELMEVINASGIGPMGMGGDTTALAVHVEYAGTHRPWMPVAVNINCWPGRRAVCRVYRDGRVEQV